MFQNVENFSIFEAMLSRCIASHEILTNEITGKASPASTLNHIIHVHVCINSIKSTF